MTLAVKIRESADEFAEAVIAERARNGIADTPEVRAAIRTLVVGGFLGGVDCAARSMCQYDGDPQATPHSFSLAVSQAIGDFETNAEGVAS